MEKLPRSGPLYNAVEEIYLRKNLFDQTRTMQEVIKEAAKKYNVPVEQLKNVLPDANQIFEGGPLSNPKAAPMETPYGKSFLSYTPEGKIAGKAGSMLRGLGRVAGTLGAAITALDLAQGLGELQDKGAAKIAEDYKKAKMAESEAEILTPEADAFKKDLKSRRTELEILRADLERKRKEEERAKERESKGMERQARVRDTLEQTGLIP
jgi:hypothetical protein